MYQALYRKWRPKTFDEVAGQSHITDTLKTQVASGRLSHAYLFTGTRGTGKTTCAKILARAVNCEHPVDGNPCNQCPACRGILDGSILDVLELDAASNNGVDQVRALRDEAVYAPAAVKKRVYIIDEVHMLTIPAFNALLKILEEPPEHLMFILATTELHKVPATVLSRCQRFSFKRILPSDLVGRLNYVAQQEGIDLTGDGAALLARLAQGDQEAKGQLIERNLRLVVYIARRFENTGINIEDLISIGTIGLIKAINTFRADKNIKLATYASRCIENEILMYLRKNSAQRTEVSFDEPLNTDWDGKELLLSDVLGTDGDVVMGPIEADVDRKLLAEAVSRLSPREKDIISLRFGLGGRKELTQKEVADRMGISQSYISRLEKRIISRLRREMQKLS